MSSGCGDVISLEDLKTAKKHQTFEAEVITGHAGGVWSGAEIDTATNSVTGQVQKTLPAILRDMGFERASFDFSTGGALGIADRNKIVYNPADNNWYSWSGTLPKIVSVGEDPTADANWKPRTDQLLRQELAGTDTGEGADLVGFRRSKLSTTIKTVAQMLNAQPIYCYEFVDVITDKPDISDPTTWDWTPAIDAAIAASKADRFQPVVLPHHAFITTGGHVITSSTPEFSGGSTGDGRKYKGVPIIGFGPDISKAKFKPASESSICFSLVGNSGGHKTAAYLRDFSIEPQSSAFQFLGYGIQYNCVNYVRTDNVAVLCFFLVMTVFLAGRRQPENCSLPKNR